jgi:phosphoribosylaminoimidazolecarboxamide formyltransferase/IMP cyclohydrolase
LRLMRIGAAEPGLVVKSIIGGYLVQTPDIHRMNRAECAVVTKRAPTDEEWRGLDFGWRVAKHVKSNAIVYARGIDGGGQIVGVGAGQMSRVDSVKIRVHSARRIGAG